jgi:hypothetical protein
VPPVNSPVINVTSPATKPEPSPTVSQPIPTSETSSEASSNQPKIPAPPPKLPIPINKTPPNLGPKSKTKQLFWEKTQVDPAKTVWGEKIDVKPLKLDDLDEVFSNMPAKQ